MVKKSIWLHYENPPETSGQFHSIPYNWILSILLSSCVYCGNMMVGFSARPHVCLFLSLRKIRTQKNPPESSGSSIPSHITEYCPFPRAAVSIVELWWPALSLGPMLTQCSVFIIFYWIFNFDIVCVIFYWIFTILQSSCPYYGNWCMALPLGPVLHTVRQDIDIVLKFFLCIKGQEAR